MNRRWVRDVLLLLASVAFTAAVALCGVAPARATATESTVMAGGARVDPRYYDTIHAINRDTAIPMDLLVRLIEKESCWEARAISTPNRNGSVDMGIMQLNSKYLGYFAMKFNGGVMFDPLDPEINLRVGMKYLAHLYRSTGSWYNAVAAYNAGLTRLQSGDIPPKTRDYLEYVFQDEGHDDD